MPFRDNQVNDRMTEPAGYTPALYRSLTETPTDCPVLALLTVDEVALLLKVSVPTVRRLLEQRALPFIKVGGSIRFAPHDLTSYLAKNRVEPIGP